MYKQCVLNARNLNHRAEFYIIIYFLSIKLKKCPPSGCDVCH